jgi:hypothetical protein
LVHFHATNALRRLLFSRFSAKNSTCIKPWGNIAIKSWNVRDNGLHRTYNASNLLKSRYATRRSYSTDNRRKQIVVAALTLCTIVACCYFHADIFNTLHILWDNSIAKVNVERDVTAPTKKPDVPTGIGISKEQDSPKLGTPTGEGVKKAFKQPSVFQYKCYKWNNKPYIYQFKPIEEPRTSPILEEPSVQELSELNKAKSELEYVNRQISIYKSIVDNYKTNVKQKTSEPKMSEPKMSEPKISEPKISEPKISEPKISEPKISEPKMSEPKMSEPKMSEPKMSEPTVRIGGTDVQQKDSSTVVKKPVTKWDSSYYVKTGVLTEKEAIDIFTKNNQPLTADEDESFVHEISFYFKEYLNEDFLTEEQCKTVLKAGYSSNLSNHDKFNNLYYWGRAYFSINWHISSMQNTEGPLKSLLLSKFGIDTSLNMVENQDELVFQSIKLWKKMLLDQEMRDFAVKNKIDLQLERYTFDFDLEKYTDNKDNK